jgi:hypothetical protein
MPDRIRLLQDYFLSTNPGRFFADDATLEDVLGEEIWRGWEAIEAWHRGARPGGLLEGQAELIRLIEGEDAIAAELTVLRAADASGGVARLPMVGIYDVQGRTIHRARLYFDTAGRRPRSNPAAGAGGR